MILLKILWQLPQSVLAWFVILFSKAKKAYDLKGKHIYVTDKRFGISLGEYIIVGKALHNSKVLDHELGHSVQSFFLGPLYLLVVGLPSITFNILTQLGVLDVKDYYKRYPENWADRISNVKR